MELEVLISNKGTRVVKATQLFQLLGLPVQHYGVMVRRWLKDVYAFREGIRRPVVMKDYAPRRQQGGGQFIEDFYLSVELAKLIALHSKSRDKLGISRRLQEYEAEEGVQHSFSQEAMSALLELTRAMCLRSCQEAAEQRHLRMFKLRNGGSAANWWRYRAHLLGYSTDGMRTQFQESTGTDAKGKNQRQMLLVLDPYELIRTGVIDHYMSLGKNREFVRNMGDLAKTLAREMKLGVFDDCQAGNIFAPEISGEFIQQLNSLQMERA
jgi:hypothetical protein